MMTLLESKKLRQSFLTRAVRVWCEIVKSILLQKKNCFDKINFFFHFSMPPHILLFS